MSMKVSGLQRLVRGGAFLLIFSSIAMNWCKAFQTSNKEVTRVVHQNPLRMFKGENQDVEDTNIPEEEVARIARNGGTKDPLRLAVLRLGMTEPRFISPLNREKRDGVYKCAGCGTTLFESRGKYDSGSGWPSFWCGTSDNKIKLKREWDGRVECTCPSCGGHLGHVFPDGPKPEDINSLKIEDIDLAFRAPGGKFPRRLPRYCINGAAMIFTPSQ